MSGHSCPFADCCPCLAHALRTAETDQKAVRTASAKIEVQDGFTLLRTTGGWVSVWGSAPGVASHTVKASTYRLSRRAPTLCLHHRHWAAAHPPLALSARPPAPLAPQTTTPPSGSTSASPAASTNCTRTWGQAAAQQVGVGASMCGWGRPGG